MVMTVTREFMRNRRIKTELQNHILEYFDYVYSDSSLYFQKNALFHDLHPALKDQVSGIMIAII